VATNFQIVRLEISSVFSLCTDMARPLSGGLLHVYATKARIFSDFSVSSSPV